VDFLPSLKSPGSSSTQVPISLELCHDKRMALAARFSFFVALCAVCLACCGQPSSDRSSIVGNPSSRTSATIARSAVATSSKSPDDVVTSSQAVTRLPSNY
jgi:hypothetical protein